MGDSLQVCDGYFFYNDGSGKGGVILDPYGVKQTDQRYSRVWGLSYRVLYATPYGSAKGQLLVDGKPVGQAVYTGCVNVNNGSIGKYTDCLTLTREGGTDFFDMNGNQRYPGKLPSGYVARYVTSAGTTVARKLDTSIIDTGGYTHYTYQLFDQSGKALFPTGDGGIDEFDAIYSPYIDWGLIYSYSLYDLQGKPLSGPFRMLLENDRILSSSSQKYTITDKSGKQLGSSFTTPYLPSVYGRFILFEQSGKLGMCNTDGKIIMQPQSGFFNSQEDPEEWYLYQYPEISRILLYKPTGAFLYDDNGTLLAQLSSGLRYGDCIISTNDQEQTFIYDLDGNLRKTYENGEEFAVYGGVHFMRENSSSLYYVVDLDGNVLSDRGFSAVSVDEESVYGIAYGKSGNGWYAVNAAGVIQNETAMDKPCKIKVFDHNLADPDQCYGVYYQNGKVGICRYVPAVGLCAKTSSGKHSWKQTEVLKPVTCTENGRVRYRCKACGKTKAVTLPSDPNAHGDGSFVKIVTPVSEGKHATAKYKCGYCGKYYVSEYCAASVFSDMPGENDPAHMAIDWAYTHKPYQVTAGIDKTHFGPDRTVTRAQAMVFFWAAKDRPKFKKASTQFVDVKKSDWYYKAVMWAVEKGITAGTDATHFSPNKTCNRGEILAFLYASLKKPKVSIKNPYKDVSNQWYKKAALWAYANGIEKGESGKFNASTPCTRASTVTYLYRFKTGCGLAE